MLLSLLYSHNTVANQQHLQAKARQLISFRILFIASTFTFFLVSFAYSQISVQPQYPQISKCYLCHKQDGRSFVDTIPTISGQNKDYLKNQLMNFKSGSRQDLLLRQMNEIASKLTDKEIDDFSDYFSKQNPAMNPPPKNINLSEKDLALYKLGESFVPMCMGCHDQAESKPALQPSWPKIKTQTREALFQQLSAMSQGKRQNPFMEFIKSPPFNDPQTLEAISLYLSVTK